MNNENENSEAFSPMPQQEVEKHRVLSRQQFTLSADSLKAAAGETQDDKQVFKVVATDEQRLVGWLVLPRYLLRSTDASQGLLGFETDKGGLLYVIPSEMKYKDRQDRAGHRFGQTEFANATPPRKDNGSRAASGKGKPVWND